MPARVHIHDRIVPAVAVPVERLGIGGIGHDGIGRHEPGQGGIVLPGPVVVETQFAVVLLVGELVPVPAAAGVDLPVGLVTAVLGVPSVCVGLDARTADMVLMEVGDGRPYLLRYPYPVDEDVGRAGGARALIEGVEVGGIGICAGGWRSLHYCAPQEILISPF